MKWLLVILILVSCTNNEDMLLYQSQIKVGVSSPTEIDGGESIFLTPDASGGEVGHGFTCTGLFFKEFNGSKPRFWVGNDGRDREPGAGGIDPQDFKASIVLVELDLTSSDNTPPISTYATKILELKTELLNDSTVQGVIEANDGTIWFISISNIINIQPYADANGNAIEIKRFTHASSNGLAYDDINDELLIKSNESTDIARYSTNGTLIDSNVVTVSVNVDQMTFDSATQILYGGIGSNGGSGSLVAYPLSGASYTVGSYSNVLASEGVAIVENPFTGLKNLFYASDAWYHQTNIVNPDLRINAIHKLDF